MAPRHVRVTLTGVVVLLLCAGGGRAEAYVIGGHRWPGRTVTYHDAGPNHAAVRTAVHAWNTSGARVRFREASRRRARVVIDRMTPGGCNGLEGVATLGYAPGGDDVHLRWCANRDEAAIVAAHELGHVLGLGHERHRCATMNPSIDGRCGEPPAYSTNCRILQVDDIRGAVKLYGGHVRRTHSPQFCPTYSRPRPPGAVQVTGSSPPAQDITARVTVPLERRLVHVPVPKPLRHLFPGAGRPWLSASVYRYAGACPTGRPHGRPVEQQTLSSRGTARIVLDERVALAPGAYCYAVWTTDAAGRRSARPATASVLVTHLAPTAAFTPPDYAAAGEETYFSDESDPGEDEIAAWAWDFGDGSTAADPSPSHTYATAGTYTVTLTVTSSTGQSSSVSHPVDVSPSGLQDGA